MALQEELSIGLVQGAGDPGAAVDREIVLRARFDAVHHVQIASEMAVPDIGDGSGGRCLGIGCRGIGCNGIRAIEVKVERRLRAAVRQDRALVGAVETVSGDIVAVDIELAAAIAPVDVVGVDLPGIAKNDGRTAAGDMDCIEGLDPPFGIGALRQNDGAVADAQFPGIHPHAIDPQRAGSEFVQAVGGHAVDAPIDDVIVVDENAGAHPGLAIDGLDGVVVIEGQRAGALVHRVLQDHGATAAEDQVLAVVERRRDGGAMLAMHRPCIVCLRQAAGALGGVIGPEDVAQGGLGDDGGIAVLCHDGVELVDEDDHERIGGSLGLAVRSGDSDQHPSVLLGVPGE